MVSEDLERRLDAYLERREDERRQGFTIEVLHRSVQTLTESFVTHQKQDDEQFRSHRVRAENLETNQDKLRERIDERYEELREQIRDVRLEVRQEKRPSSSSSSSPPSSFWRELNRGAVGWVVKGAFLVAGGGAYALLRALFGGGH